MQNLSITKNTFYKFGLISDDAALIQKVDSENTHVIQSIKALQEPSHFRVLVVDYNFILKHDAFDYLKKKCTKLIFIFKDASINPTLFKNTPPDHVLFSEDFNEQIFIDQDQALIEKEQNAVYLNLAADLNTEYENIKMELEAKLDETKHDLLASRQKILDANIRTEAMRKILFSITQERDLHRIETILNDLLPASSKATWIKIVPEQQQKALEVELNQQLNTTFKFYSLPDHVIFFIKGDQKSFKKDDLNLFSKIKDVIEINYNREVNYTNLARTENIVRKAFDEFNHPMAVIDSSYTLIQANATFNRHASKKQLCYEVLFNTDKPCPNCHLGAKYSTEVNGAVFDVYSNPIAIDNNPTKLWINLYKNKTQEHHFEQRLNQTVKMKELGIISSSIAHELNNPIGGILSYLQLIQMDLAKDHAMTADIKAMVETTLRMKKIIEDLLIFSRINNFKDTDLYNMADLVQESLSIHEIHFKNENIKIVNHAAGSDVQLKISKAAFRDALHFIFNFYIEKIKTFRKSHSQKTGLVEVKFSTHKSSTTDQLNYYIEFQGNCGTLDEAEKSKDISLLALSKCLTDQNMHLEIAAPSENWISLKVIVQKS